MRLFCDGAVLMAHPLATSLAAANVYSGFVRGNVSKALQFCVYLTIFNIIYTIFTEIETF